MFYEEILSIKAYCFPTIFAKLFSNTDKVSQYFEGMFSSVEYTQCVFAR